MTSAKPGIRISSLSSTWPEASCQVEFLPSFWVFKTHFPQNPILPAAQLLQFVCDFIIENIREQIGCEYLIWVSELLRAHFQSMVRPNELLQIRVVSKSLPNSQEPLMRNFECQFTVLKSADVSRVGQGKCIIKVSSRQIERAS